MSSTLIASRPLRYNARALLAGQEFHASDRDARLLIALGRADPKGPPPVQVEPIEAPVAEPAPLDRPKRQYRRRDMAAADVFAPESAPEFNVRSDQTAEVATDSAPSAGPASVE